MAIRSALVTSKPSLLLLTCFRPSEKKDRDEYLYLGHNAAPMIPGPAIQSKVAQIVRAETTTQRQMKVRSIRHHTQKEYG